jgi:hypothetical protein
MSELDQLGQSGDPLEQAIVRLAGEELRAVLVPYSQIWTKYVVPNRISQGETVEKVWLRFAASHYTALIRVYNARSFHKEIQRICSQCFDINDGDFLLDQHAATAAFWWSLGSAVDNLGDAIEGIPGCTLKGQDAGKKGSSGGGARRG